nr:MAG TPA: hypothetical protein [Myoviridae sp. ctNqw6]
MMLSSGTSTAFPGSMIAIFSLTRSLRSFWMTSLSISKNADYNIIRSLVTS